MPLPEKKVQLALENLCEGKLNQEFVEALPKILGNLPKGKKANITIGVEIERIPDTDTMLRVSYSFSYKTPPVKKSSACQVTGDNNILTDEIPEPMRVLPFTKAEGGNK